MVYCSSCGTAASPGLAYCSRCGAKLVAGDRDKAPRAPAGASPDGLVWAIVSVLVGGIGVIIGLLSTMKKALGFDDAVILAFALLCLMLVAAAVGAFIWLLVRGVLGGRAGLPARPRKLSTNELDAAEARALPEPPASVTEGTTRSFEPLGARLREEE